MTERLLGNIALKKLFQSGKVPAPSDFGHLIDMADAARAALGLKTMAPVSDGVSPGEKSGLIYRKGYLSLDLGEGLKLDAHGRLTFDSKTEQAIRDDQTKKINLRELISNNLAKLNVVSGRITWEGNSEHNGWHTGKDEKVDLLTLPNDGLPELKGVSSAIRLAVDNKPGRIFSPVSLIKGESYMFSWIDAGDKHHTNPLPTEVDQYTLRISTSDGNEATGFEYQSAFKCSADWAYKGTIFTPQKTGLYYISFRGKAREDGRKLGALVSAISGRNLS